MRKYHFMYVNLTLFLSCSGYMAPEYAFHGFFSVKTDVYSFGVLVLEMITGRKSYDVHNEEYSEDLLSFVSIYSPNKLQCGVVHHPVKKVLISSNIGRENEISLEPIT